MSSTGIGSGSATMASAAKAAKVEIPQTDAEAVREFTRGAGQPTPDRPEPMSRDQVFFLAKMMLDEIMELTATVATPAESKEMLKRFVDESRDLPMVEYKQPNEQKAMLAKCADQADALVDSYYYSLNAAAKHGMNLSAVFGVVHAANMAKRDPVSGEFLKREDGKIIKPAGWQPPNIEAEMERQWQFGSFTSWS